MKKKSTVTKKKEAVSQKKVPKKPATRTKKVKKSTEKEPWTDSVKMYRQKLVEKYLLLYGFGTAEGKPVVITEMTDMSDMLCLLGPGYRGDDDEIWTKELIAMAFKDGTISKLSFHDLKGIFRNWDNEQYKLGLSEMSTIFWKAVEDGVLMDMTLNDVLNVIKASKYTLKNGRDSFSKRMTRGIVKNVSTQVNKTLNKAKARSTRFAKGLKTAVTFGAS